MTIAKNGPSATQTEAVMEALCRVIMRDFPDSDNTGDGDGFEVRTATGETLVTLDIAAMATAAIYAGETK